MNDLHSHPPQPEKGSFTAVVNERTVNFEDPMPLGEQILALAGYEPADEYVLIEEASVGSRLISLDETVNLNHGTPARFFAFRSGEVFMFTVNTHGYQWGRPDIREDELREIAHVSASDVLVLLHGDAPPEVISEGQVVSLQSRGTEHFRTESRLITVFIDKAPKEIARGIYTTEQLLVLLGVQPGYLLNLQRDGGLETLKPGQKTRVEPGMQFFSQAPGGASS
jgi:hypothetical protein